jgi:hypothetical protein
MWIKFLADPVKTQADALRNQFPVTFFKISVHNNSYFK